MTSKRFPNVLICLVSLALLIGASPSKILAQPLGPQHLGPIFHTIEPGKAQTLPPVAHCELLTPDFVVTGSSSTSGFNEFCFPSDGNGSFVPRSDVDGLGIVDGMDVADMDNDGDNDFLACDGLTGEVYLYTQGPPTVFTPTTIATGITGAGGVGGPGSLCTYLRIADFNNDGLADFVVGDFANTQGIFVYLQGSGVFNKVPTALDTSWANPTGGACNCVFGLAAGDVDADGHDDVLVLGFSGVGAGQVWFYQGNGGTMAAPSLVVDVSADFPVVTNPTGLALFDYEGDGDLDIVVGGSFDGSHYIYINNGINNYTPLPTVAFDINNYSGIDAYDIDDDWRDDLMLVDWTSQRLLFIKNQGGSLAAPAVVGTVDAPSLGVGAPEPSRREGFHLDHFKCYVAAAKEQVDETVGLSDQFDSGAAEVFETRRFCTAVAKFHDEVLTPIQNEDAHLEMLTLENVEGQTPGLVEVTNQFGEGQKLDLGNPAFLAVPTQKIEPGNHPFPKDLDHFKCYEVFGETKPIRVDLRDQFGFEEGVVATTPQLLCNPTKKEHNEEVTPIGNPFDHLVCYELENTQQIAEFAFIRNQFGERSLWLEPADMLCLPSEKRVIQ